VSGLWLRFLSGPDIDGLGLTNAEILAAVQAAKREFAADLAAAEPAAALRRPPLASTWDGPRLPTQGHALLHILEELAQHHGQAELTRDLLLASQPAR